MQEGEVLSQSVSRFASDSASRFTSRCFSLSSQYLSLSLPYISLSSSCSYVSWSISSSRCDMGRDHGFFTMLLRIFGRLSFSTRLGHELATCSWLDVHAVTQLVDAEVPARTG
jgi:hypothetical protein